MNEDFKELRERMQDIKQLWMQVKELEDENDKLRFILAKGEGECVYCGLPKKDMARCIYGFPGCGRADDLQNGETTAAHAAERKPK